MMQKKEKKNRSIKDKLINAVDSIKVDVFGYERKVTENIILFLAKVADANQFKMEDLFARIMKKEQGICLEIFHQGVFLREVKVNELVSFFLGENGDFKMLQSQILSNLSAYIIQFSRENRVSERRLQFGIIGTGKTVRVSAYEDVRFIRDLPLKELIKQFQG